MGRQWQFVSKSVSSLARRQRERANAKKGQNEERKERKKDSPDETLSIYESVKKSDKERERESEHNSTDRQLLHCSSLSLPTSFLTFILAFPVGVFSLSLSLSVCVCVQVSELFHVRSGERQPESGKKEKMRARERAGQKLTELKVKNRTQKVP